MVSANQIIITKHAKDRFQEKIDRQAGEELDQLIHGLYCKSQYVPTPTKILDEPVCFTRRLVRYERNGDTRRIILIIKDESIVTLYPVRKRNGKFCPDKREPIQ